MTEMDFKGVPINKLNHRQKFLYRRKLKRKRQRQINAIKEIEEIVSEDHHERDQEMEEKERLEELQRQEQERLWLQREKEAQKLFAKAKAEREAEELRTKEKQANGNPQRSEEFAELPDYREKIQAELFRRLKEGIEEISDPASLPQFHRPEPPRATFAAQATISGQMQTTPELCGFFWKTGACRYGDRCSRLHPSAPLSERELQALIEKSDVHDPAPPLVLILVNMFAHFSLSAESRAPEEADDSLEVDEAALLSDYYEFYVDVYEELTARWGRILGFRTCCNRSDHLRGNVYVQFADPSVAYDALRACQNRWYAGRQVSGRIAYLGCGWKGAVCGLHHRGRCPKGNSMCNFLHVFTNPEETTRDLLLALSHNLPQLPPVQQSRVRRRGRSNSSDSDLPPSEDPPDPSPSRSRRSHDHRQHRHHRHHRRRRHRRSSSRSSQSSHGSSPIARRRNKKHRRTRS